MNIIAEYGRDDLAKVYVIQMRQQTSTTKHRHHFLVECVESLQPPLTRDKKWVLIVSSMFGCPVQCLMCDAGGEYADMLTKEEILSQVEYMVNRRFPNGKPLTEKFKIQFARMGEPSLNPAVLEALEHLGRQYTNVFISVSSIAPKSPVAQSFFEELIQIKNKYFTSGRFQLQFSIHTTDEEKRALLIPVKKWSFEEIASFGERFYSSKNGDRKITLNFAPAVGYPIDVDCVSRYFDPQRFLIKLTPMNPTIRSQEQGLVSAIDPYQMNSSEDLLNRFKQAGYDVIVSIGVLEENEIGSNCGQFVQRALQTTQRPNKSYELERYSPKFSSCID